jgi:hypothetical protein
MVWLHVEDVPLMDDFRKPVEIGYGAVVAVAFPDNTTGHIVREQHSGGRPAEYHQRQD